MKLLFLIVIGCGVCQAQDSGTLINHTFEDGVSGWHTINGATVTTAVDQDRHSLVFEYNLDADRIAFVGLETKKGVAGLGGLRFKVKADYDTSLLVNLTEPKPGLGRNTYVTVRGGRWEQFDLKVSDFGPGDNPGDPLDLGPPLDLNRVQGFGISDAAYTYRKPGSNLARTFGIEAPTGKHTLLMQDFQALKGNGDLPQQMTSVAIDRFDRGMLQWILFGKARWSLVDSSPLTAPALELTSTSEHPAQPVAVYRRMTSFDLEGTDGVEFDVAASQPSAVIASIGVRTPDGIRNDIAAPLVPVTGSRTPVHIRLPYEKFGGGKGITVIPIAIVTLTIAVVTPATGQNTFWISDVRAFRSEAPAK
jgi:hypothetical protein